MMGGVQLTLDPVGMAHYTLGATATVLKPFGEDAPNPFWSLENNGGALTDRGRARVKGLYERLDPAWRVISDAVGTELDPAGDLHGVKCSLDIIVPALRGLEAMAQEGRSVDPCPLACLRDFALSSLEEVADA